MNSEIVDFIGWVAFSLAVGISIKLGYDYFVYFDHLTEMQLFKQNLKLNISAIVFYIIAVAAIGDKLNL